jgi:hypothetical protein
MRLGGELGVPTLGGALSVPIHYKKELCIFIFLNFSLSCNVRFLATSDSGQYGLTDSFCFWTMIWIYFYFPSFEDLDPPSKFEIDMEPDPHNGIVGTFWASDFSMLCCYSPEFGPITLRQSYIWVSSLETSFSISQRLNFRRKNFSVFFYVVC